MRKSVGGIAWIMKWSTMVTLGIVLILGYVLLQWVDLVAGARQLTAMLPLANFQIGFPFTEHVIHITPVRIGYTLSAITSMIQVVMWILNLVHGGKRDAFFAVAVITSIVDTFIDTGIVGAWMYQDYDAKKIWHWQSRDPAFWVVTIMLILPTAFNEWLSVNIRTAIESVKEGLGGGNPNRPVSGGGTGKQNRSGSGAVNVATATAGTAATRLRPGGAARVNPDADFRPVPEVRVRSLPSGLKVQTLSPAQVKVNMVVSDGGDQIFVLLDTKDGQAVHGYACDTGGFPLNGGNAFRLSYQNFQHFTRVVK